MSSCSTCFLNGISYTFSQDDFDMQQAQNQCKKNGENLATNLDEQTYKGLNDCCSNGQRYRIGLVADSRCNDNAKNKFRWLDEDNCRRPNPLQPRSPTLKCQTVSLLLSSQKGIPQAHIDECSTKQRFICQTPTKTTTSSQITIAESTSKLLSETTTSTQSRTTTEEITTYKNIAQASSALSSVSDSSLSFTPKQTYSTVQITASLPSSSNLGLIVGIAVPSLISIILLVILCLFCHKKTNLKYANDVEMTKDISGFGGVNKEMIENQLYSEFGGNRNAEGSTYEVVSPSLENYQPCEMVEDKVAAASEQSTLHPL